jgi:hypothetical protein
MDEQPIGCARVSGSVSDAASPQAGPPSESIPAQGTTKVTARVGQKAPEFTAPAFFRGGLTNVKLSDFSGKWVLLCFYPLDFTFV